MALSGRNRRTFNLADDATESGKKFSREPFHCAVDEAGAITGPMGQRFGSSMRTPLMPAASAMAAMFRLTLRAPVIGPLHASEQPRSQQTGQTRHDQPSHRRRKEERAGSKLNGRHKFGTSGAST